ncbi:hypothetical protein C8J57DRAFT_1300619 [Mycena rebaudengoi]|nr:hypothetical protein C8J57DRAFT_1300619 [Mycena rebaudengoi]
MTDHNLDSLLSDTTRSGRSTMSDVRGRISELDARNLTLDAAVELERQDLQTHLGEYKCPVLTLPAEITSEIFVHFLPPYPERPPTTGLSSPEFFGQICRTWREISLGTPRLWRAIQLCPEEELQTRALDLLKTWLLRSKDCPLSICLEYDPYSPNMGVIPFVEAILAHAERWEYINLEMPFNPRVLNLIASGSDFPLPLLRSVTLRHCALSRDVPEAPPSLFGIAPKLKKVTLSSLSLGPAIELPWSQLTTISIQSLREAQCVEIFQQAAALAEFRCDRVFRDGDEDPSPVAPLRSLKSLALECRFLLDRLTTPALQHLSISDSRSWVASQLIDKVNALILRSRCTLVSLRITRTIESAAPYRAAFPLIPTITATMGRS